MQDNTLNTMQYYKLYLFCGSSNLNQENPTFCLAHIPQHFFPTSSITTKMATLATNSPAEYCWPPALFFTLVSYFNWWEFLNSLQLNNINGKSILVILGFDVGLDLDSNWFVGECTNLRRAFAFTWGFLCQSSEALFYSSFSTKTHNMFIPYIRIWRHANNSFQSQKCEVNCMIISVACAQACIKKNKISVDKELNSKRTAVDRTVRALNSCPVYFGVVKG